MEPTVRYLEPFSPGRPPIRITAFESDFWISAQPIAHGAAQLCRNDRKRPRPADVIDVEELESDNNDDCHLIASSEARVFQPQKARKKPLSYPTQQQRIIPLAQLLQKLSLQELATSGYRNNCLWFSVQLATSQLCVTQQFSKEAERQSEHGRAQIHSRLLQDLPAGARACDSNANWWVGMSASRAKRIFKDSGMMVEQHVFALATSMNTPIVTIDTRMAAVVIQHYRPGYVVCGHTISLEDACKLRHDKSCVWLRLHDAHYRALVPVVTL